MRVIFIDVLFCHHTTAFPHWQAGKQSFWRENIAFLRAKCYTESIHITAGGERKGREIVVCRSVSRFPVIARPVRTLVVAIPRIEGKCTEKYPKEWDLLRFLVGIVTWFLSTGGLPHQCAHWFAMTEYTRQTPIDHAVSGGGWSGFLI